MVTKHGVPSSTELVRDDMAEYEDNPRPVPVSKHVKKRPNTQSARYGFAITTQSRVNSICQTSHVLTTVKAMLACSYYHT